MHRLAKPSPFTTLGTSTGRTCDGYDPPPTTKLAQFVTVLPVHYQSQEVRAFQYFHERTLVQLATLMPDDFWNETVLQMSNSEQGIWHSIVALSAYHELYLTGARSRHERQDSFALRHYNLSIKSILGPQRTSTDAHIHVASCIMFICIEVGWLRRPPAVSRSNCVDFTRKHISCCWLTEGRLQCAEGSTHDDRPLRLARKHAWPADQHRYSI